MIAGSPFLLRLEVYDILQNWRANKPPRLWTLLGYGSHDEMCIQWSDKDVTVCEMLLSPHGYTIYKALIASKDLDNAVVMEEQTQDHGSD